MSIEIRRLGAEDIAIMREMNTMFAAAFAEPESYLPSPGDDYLRRTLAKTNVIVLAAIDTGQVAGGLVAYVLDKLEQERSEIYIYDLAIAEERRRRGIATALIAELQRIATDSGAWVIYVQADHGDDPAIALYTKLGRREDVMHFDISPGDTR